MFKKLGYVIVVLFFTNSVIAQQDINELSKQFDALSAQKKGLNETIKIDVSGLTLHDFISSIAEEHQLNIDVDTDLNQPVSNNFFDAYCTFVYLLLKYSNFYFLICWMLAKKTFSGSMESTFD